MKNYFTIFIAVVAQNKFLLEPSESSKLSIVIIYNSKQVFVKRCVLKVVDFKVLVRFQRKISY